MKITSLVENTSLVGLPVEHGLSLHIRMDDGRQVLFDMGQRRLFADNAERLGINLADVDMAVVSHGHYDHGGGLRTFLGLNSKAKVYVSRHAFEPHYSLRDDGLKYIGIDPELETDDRLVFCADVTRIDKDIILFSGVNRDCLKPIGNRLLFGPAKETNDDFRHEQSLVVREGVKTILFAGCAHAGIVNIMRKGMLVTGTPFTHVFAGMHLVKSGLTEKDEATFIHSLADELSAHTGCRYFTMHCTGAVQYGLLKNELDDDISYMGCGDIIEI